MSPPAQPNRLRPKFAGLFSDDARNDSFWIRESGQLTLPTLNGVGRLVVVGEMLAPTKGDRFNRGELGLAVILDGHEKARNSALPHGPFRLALDLRSGAATTPTHLLELKLFGVGWSNFLAWLARVSCLAVLQPWRRQPRNRRLRIQRIEADGEVVFDFANRNAPYSTAFARRHVTLGVNIAGFLTAELGVGESARCMVRAADAVHLPAALVSLRLHCKNPLGDQTYAGRLQTTNPHAVNVIHLDPPASGDLDHHHPGFRTGRYNIAYWAWELPEFPDAWVQACSYFDEVWCPSDFVREAIALKVPLPVITMPHAIGFAPPAGDARARFGLPADRFLFLVLYDLNSYSERKNPDAAIEAFRRSGLAGRAVLVIKVHNVRGNEADLARLQAAVADLPETVLITETLSREAVYQLEAACDCYVSLHRSEGFGLTVAECMLVGKPVIVTDWSATAEFVNPTNGCPVRYRLAPLEQNHGPYGKGQIWADADPDHAADWMRRLHADTGLCAQLGASAHATIIARFSPGVVGARYRRRLESIAAW